MPNVAHVDDPAIAVVVPARNAEQLLPDLLAALERSTCEDPWELVVVDDASSDSTAAIAEAWGARVVRLEGQSGPAAARNAGLATATAPLIAFTDADCVPSPQWLGEVAAALHDGADLVTGPVLPVTDADHGPFARTLRITRGSPLFETANLGVTTAMAARVGGFEPFAPRADRTRVGLRPAVEEGHFGEDAVFGWRACRLGARIAFSERAVVYHAVFARGPRGYIAERWRLRFFPALVRELPELRGALTLRYFLSATTAQFDLAAAGVVTAALSRRPWPLGATVPYVARRLSWRNWWRRSVARRNLALVAADAAGLLALMRGSIAARRLLI